MSIWDDQWEDYELDKNDFEAWLDHINTSGDPDRDEEFYNLEMEKQNGKYTDSNWESFVEEEEIEQEIMSQSTYPEYMVKGKDYIMTISDN
jgi:hypothetical protein